MKHMLNRASRRTGHALAPRFSASLLTLGFALTLALSACTKSAGEEEGLQSANAPAPQSESAGNALGSYTGLSSTTLWELQQARAATARYRKLSHAIQDGYIDIGVHDPKMGHHFMKNALVDGNFDYRNPEILVYSKDVNGQYTLVAVEYAVPRNLSEPAGFSGSGDAWNGTSPFPFWLLHAWVWAYNPDGVFSPMNPNVNSIP